MDASTRDNVLAVFDETAKLNHEELLLATAATRLALGEVGIRWTLATDPLLPRSMQEEVAAERLTEIVERWVDDITEARREKASEAREKGRDDGYENDDA